VVWEYNFKISVDEPIGRLCKRELFSQRLASVEFALSTFLNIHRWSSGGVDKEL
jgi:hypothetical protein